MACRPSDHPTAAIAASTGRTLRRGQDAARLGGSAGTGETPARKTGSAGSFGPSGKRRRRGASGSGPGRSPARVLSRHRKGVAGPGVAAEQGPADGKRLSRADPMGTEMNMIM
ncbi:Hypothetical Protein RSKD131_4148 [Cereibacter sphaeroides KD131]|nr:Hypothetical Protein RSKD131_4148 [Cereibacter sphaeroides KD131]